ncbi:hypothetical protein OCU04_010374 [Sclerotinia nivalis]|uniref:Uncharacterized protein n=1 Tax=Sclerotinia nivalis TaxID=352851 RepID=A0A9X0AEE2_9HELO|nr:hypothetical protein OCU04_010374 [Sclerotinia nivalis]
MNWGTMISISLYFCCWLPDFDIRFPYPLNVSGVVYSQNATPPTHRNTIHNPQSKRIDRPGAPNKGKKFRDSRCLASMISSLLVNIRCAIGCLTALLQNMR